MKKKAIIITINKRIESYIINSLNKLEIQVDTSYESLNSIKAIKRSIAQTRNAQFFAKSFLRLIGKTSFPDLIVLDYKIDLGLNSEIDPDNRKLLNALFILILSLHIQEKHHDIVANILLIINEIDFNQVNQLISNPAKFLDILKPKNKAIIDKIDQMKKNPSDFENLFNIHFVVRNYHLEEIDEKINDILNENNSNEKKPEKPITELKKICQILPHWKNQMVK